WSTPRITVTSSYNLFLLHYIRSSGKLLVFPQPARANPIQNSFNDASLSGSVTALKDHYDLQTLVLNPQLKLY
ncbi:MAG: hypothetical protein WCA22_12030, partial [Candidatus Binatus sp.]